MLLNLNIIRPENIFLIILGFIWIIGAILQDLKRREIDNFWNFSLIAIALVYRLSISVLKNDFSFILYGIGGFLVFLIIGYLFYYLKLFGGGDTKLLIALGTILPFSNNLIISLKLLFYFVLLLLISGSIYSLIYAFVLSILKRKKFAKEFIRQFKINKKLLFLGIIIFGLFEIIGLISNQISFILLGAIILLFPILFIFSKSIEESCLIKKISPLKIKEGDWLYKNIKVNKKIIKANWQGISEKELKLIQKKYKKNILIKQGVPFAPSFLIALILLILLVFNLGFLF